MYKDFTKDHSVVQKYGGTSVGSIERIKSVASRVAKQFQDGWTKLAIVVSAQSGETNRLIDLIKRVDANPPVDAYDMALAAGEQISVALLCAALASEGIKATPFLGFQLGILTDEFHNRARIKSINVDPILKSWEASKVAVIAGFQGVTESMEITTLGRGGSDTSAVALAIALNSAFCEINTDVNGVYTADPRIVTDAKLIESLDYEAALEMASLGSKVLHPRSAELGKKFNMPLVVRNSFTSNDSERTRIMNFSTEQQLESPVVSGITSDTGVVKISIDNIQNNPLVVSKLFSAISERSINVDIIIFNRSNDDKTVKVGFTTEKDAINLVKEALSSLKNDVDFKDIDYSVENKFAKVSVVGVGMRSYSGVASRAFTALSKAGIEIQMISTSEIKISCVVDVNNATKAVQVLHSEFL